MAQRETHPDASRTRIVRPLRGGQIAIPAEFRRQLGIRPDSMLQVTREGDELRIKPLRPTQPVGQAAGATWFKELYDLFAPIRAEAVERGYTEEEINGWIDDAVAATRNQSA